MNKITIDNPQKYDIYFSGSFAALKEKTAGVIKGAQKAYIVTDSNVAPLYLDEVTAQLDPLFTEISTCVIEAGEQSKTLRSAETIIKDMIEKGFARDDLIIALGGGVIGDLSGFCAAVYMRGIDFIQIPTTLLSQIDSSIGGKVAVDMDAYKNMVGAFHSPLLVYENSSCLKTLPEEQFLSGMGEVIKSALLGDEKLWRYLQENLSGLAFPDIDAEVLLQILYKTCCVKKKIVDEDPFDKGKRAVLNLGHTFGHAIEKCSGFRLFHGECVALGTIAASFISMKRGSISESEFKAISDFTGNIGLKISVPAELKLNKGQIISAMSKDKKNTASGLKFILLESCGNAVISGDVTQKEIEQALEVIGIM